MEKEREYGILWVLLVALAAAILALGAAGLLLSAETIDTVFAETGPFERASIWLWVILGLACLGQRSWPFGRRALFAVLAFVLAMREADWHKAFTTDSIFKSNYYLEAAAPVWEKVIGGAVAVAALVVLIRVASLGWRGLVTHRGITRPWGILAVIGAVLLPVVKVLDRAYNVLNEDYGIQLSPQLRSLTSALEEGTEALLPLLFLAAIWLHRMRTSRPPGPT